MRARLSLRYARRLTIDSVVRHLVLRSRFRSRQPQRAVLLVESQFVAKTLNHHQKGKGQPES